MASVANLPSTPLSKSARGLFKTMEAIKGEADSTKEALLPKLKQALLAEKLDVKKLFESGEITGIKAAETIALRHDDILCALFKYTCEIQFPILEAGQAEHVALCAVGGYGRGEMAPFSDLDLLILNTAKSDTSRCEKVSEFILYLLWDMGLKVGHAIRTPEQSITLARQDETVLTALLDLRLLAGAPEPATELIQLLRKERTGAKTRAFIAAKLGSRDARHQREGNSRYVIEPNIKEGKGGLRDLHELYWISRFIYGGKKSKIEPPIKPHGVAAYLRLGLLDPSAAKRFTKAAEFLWQSRIHLHFLADRALEVLSFDRQDAMAVRMGYKQQYPEERVEAFMRDYFMTAREVGALTRIACAKLEEQSTLLLPHGLDRLLPTSRRGLKAPGFVLDHGRLDFVSARKLKNNPLLLLDLFRVAGNRNLDIHPDAFAAILKNMHLIDDDFRKNPKASEIFQDILLNSKAPGAVLKTMNEAGVLGAYLPEFGAIVGRTQFNMHHAYTVDDHTLALVRYLHDIESGERKREHPLTTAFIKEWDSRLRRMVYMACLFHDVGKGQGDQCIEGAALARDACRRLGLPDTEIETIAWLVRNHLEMSETAQRRDTSDPETVKTFARTVGSIARLQMLTALTCVDIRSVGPGIWNDWKGELLRQLYQGASMELMGEYEAIEHKAADKFIDTLSSELGPDYADASGSVFNALPAHYWQNYSEAEQLKHAAFFKDAELNSFPHHVETHLNTDIDITELWVKTSDRKNLFADLALAIASCGASVKGADLHTGDKGVVFNVFYIQNNEGLAFGRKNPRRLTDLVSATKKAAAGDVDKLKLPQTLPSRRAAAIPIHPRISIDQKSPTHAIIEVEGRDRPGLLYALASTLSSHDLSVNSAHIEVAGPKAIDVFYVDHEPDINLS
ncbi:MAG: [protein-PII] uridylyltransferase, partial [Acidimicrobiales bacterium]